MENNGLESHGLGVLKIAPWLLLAGIVLGAICYVYYPPDLSSIVKAILIGVITTGIHFFYWRNGSFVLAIIALMLFLMGQRVMDYPFDYAPTHWVKVLDYFAWYVVGSMSALLVFKNQFKKQLSQSAES